MSHAAPVTVGRHASDRPNRKRKFTAFVRRHVKAIAITVGAAVVVPATFVGAVLTEHSEIAGNSMSKSSYSVVVTGDPMLVANVKPGGIYTSSFTVTNPGTLPGDAVISFNVSDGRELLDAADITVTLTGAINDTAGGAGVTNWTNGKFTLMGVQPGAIIYIQIDLHFDLAIDTPTWVALPQSALFDIDSDTQQSNETALSALYNL